MNNDIQDISFEVALGVTLLFHFRNFSQLKVKTLKKIIKDDSTYQWPINNVYKRKIFSICPFWQQTQ